MKTIFSNLLQVRATQTELVLEFGSFFPTSPSQGIPSNYEPEVRIVMNAMMVESLVKALQNMPHVSQPGQQQSKQVGFQKPTE